MIRIAFCYCVIAIIYSISNKLKSYSTRIPKFITRRYLKTKLDPDIIRPDLIRLLIILTTPNDGRAPIYGLCPLMPHIVLAYTGYQVKQNDGSLGSVLDSTIRHHDLTRSCYHYCLLITLLVRSVTVITDTLHRKIYFSWLNSFVPKTNLIIPTALDSQNK